jgi:hypothetical protein
MRGSIREETWAPCWPLPVGKRHKNVDYYGSVSNNLDRMLALSSNIEHQKDD